VGIIQTAAEDRTRGREIRLRALADAPDAFGSTYERGSTMSEAEWRCWATGWPGSAAEALFVTSEEALRLGIALGVRWEADRDTANLYAMWVEPSARERGLRSKST
jgi:hypothetical protein